MQVISAPVAGKQVHFFTVTTAIQRCRRTGRHEVREREGDREMAGSRQMRRDRCDDYRWVERGVKGMKKEVCSSSEGMQGRCRQQAEADSARFCLFAPLSPYVFAICDRVCRL